MGREIDRVDRRGGVRVPLLIEARLCDTLACCVSQHSGPRVRSLYSSGGSKLVMSQ